MIQVVEYLFGSPLHYCALCLFAWGTAAAFSTTTRISVGKGKE